MSKYPLRVIMVAVDYTDLLSVTLPYNRHHFESVTIVTDDGPGGYDSILPIALANNAKVIATDRFYRDGAIFNKWSALEYGLDIVGRHGWICLMDADVLWPKEIHLDLVQGRLYSPLRHMAPWPLPRSTPSLDCPKCNGSGDITTPPYEQQVAEAEQGKRKYLTKEPCDCYVSSLPPENAWHRYPVHRNIGEWAGYTQIFHADDRALGQPPWHQTDWAHAGGADSFFQAKWMPGDKVRTPWNVLHLGEAGANWYGRATPYADGTMPVMSEEKRKRVSEIWTNRRGKTGDARFAGERL